MPEKRGCRVCSKKIKITRERFNTTHNKRIRTSDEGVFFNFDEGNIGCWFCNECWEKIRK